MNITIPDDHKDPKDCQVIIALTGTKEEILRRLEEICDQIRGSYGKPYQGTGIGYKVVSTVYTPIWKGVSY